MDREDVRILGYCEECGAELRYQPEDVKRDKSLEGVAGYIEYIVCPNLYLW